MKITDVQVYELKIPFSTGVKKKPASNFLKADAIDFCLVKVDTDIGITGWGDAFSFHCRRAVAEAINHMVKPHLIGKNPLDIQQINFELQKKLHLFGRYGITMFAISGVDIALWDIVAKHSINYLYVMFLVQQVIKKCLHMLAYGVMKMLKQFKIDVSTPKVLVITILNCMKFLHLKLRLQEIF